ncbi:MAG: GNAT family N-acetyltransferase [Fimbriimonadaceae bacterium]|nr:GNAT family N-acetyltransferase [Fimbriimonadaceae bacterium]
MGEVLLRAAAEADVGAVIALYRAAYGDSFPFKEFYDAQWVKRGIFDDGIVWVVAEHEGQVLGSAAVMLEAGDRNDLIGEFGRLVVHPAARSLGLGSKLMQARLERVSAAIEFGFAECRTAHPGAQKIAVRSGFAPVGLEPLAYLVDDRRESVLLVAKLFGNAVRLRRNNPRVIPAVHAIGSLALRACGLDDDLLVESRAEPYPTADGERLAELEDQQVYRLLRLTRDRLATPEVFGGMRLEYGFLKLKAHAGRYLVVLRGETIVGGLGYVCDDIDSKVRVFELVAVDDRARGAILELGLAQIEALHDPAYLQVDVAAHQPRIQATLACLGFVPVAYCPSMVFAAGERLDVVKMVKLRLPVRLTGMELVDEGRELARLVEEQLIANARGVELDDVARRVQVFQGLTDVQIGRIRAVCREVPYTAGETVFARESTDQALFIVLEGSVDIVLGERAEPVAAVGPGQIFGELALIDDLPRSAGAVCATASRLLVVRRADFQDLCRRDPELGVVVLRNIARTLSERLRDTNLRVEGLVAHTARLLARS